MSAHTPGPWRVGKNYGSVVADHPVQEIRGSDAVEAYGGHLIAESIAPRNQPIIAAAPEMLDLLKTIENDGQQVPAWLWERIQAVIAKAENPAPKPLSPQLGGSDPGPTAGRGPDSPDLSDPGLSPGAASEASRSAARPGGLAADAGKEHA